MCTIIICSHILLNSAQDIIICFLGLLNDLLNIIITFISGTFFHIKNIVATFLYCKSKAHFHVNMLTYFGVVYVNSRSKCKCKKFIKQQAEKIKQGKGSNVAMHAHEGRHLLTYFIIDVVHRLGKPQQGGKQFSMRTYRPGVKGGGLPPYDVLKPALQ